MPVCSWLTWRQLLLCLTAVVLFAACGGGGANGFTPGPPLAVESQAPPIPRDPAPAGEISLPPGFIAYEFAAGLNQPTSLAFDPSGRLFVAELRGRVSVIEDQDGDGFGERSRSFWRDADERFTLGLAVAPDGSLYVSVRGEVVVLRDTDNDGRADMENVIITGLPNRIHLNNGLAFGPDGKLYVTNGSTCNLCPEEDERSATILRADLDGDNVEVYASGLRNAYDLTFDSEGGLWATANEHDYPREPEAPGYEPVLDAPDELNYIVEGGHYGWPECVASGVEIIPDGCHDKVAPVVEFDPYSSSDGIAFYQGDNFPTEYRGNLFVAQFGNNEDSPRQTGRRIVRVEVTSAAGPEAYTATVTEFATGFERPLEVTVDALGTLYVADFQTGKIYRIVWAGP